MTLDDSGFLTIGAQQIEYRMLGPRPDTAPTLVLLHEGLGSATMWGNFPERLAQSTGAGVFLYSRAGYGQSSPATLPRPFTYMHDEAREVLPKVLDAIGLRRGIIIGHSDGASITAIYAGSRQDHRVGALVLIAPHFYTEDANLASIVEIRTAYATTDLRAKLARWHKDVDNAFEGWSGAWLSPPFRDWDITEYLAYIRVPILIVQGEDDQYGSMAQIDVARDECYCPVDVALIPGARHSPHRETPDAAFAVVSQFVKDALRDQPAVA